MPHTLTRQGVQSAFVGRRETERCLRALELNGRECPVLKLSWRTMTSATFRRAAGTERNGVCTGCTVCIVLRISCTTSYGKFQEKLIMLITQALLSNTKAMA